MAISTLSVVMRIARTLLRVTGYTARLYLKLRRNHFTVAAGGATHRVSASRGGRMFPLRGAFVKAEHSAEIGQNCAASLLGDGKRTRNV